MSVFTIKTAAKGAKNRIEVAFSPLLSLSCKDCLKIAFVQFIKPTANHLPVSWEGLEGASSEYLDNITYNRSDPAAIDRYAVDILPGQRTPWTQESNGPPYEYGQKNSGIIRNATMFDTPFTKATGAKFGGFFDAVKNPKGCKSVQFSFFTVAVCAAGAECGKWYESFSWEWTLSAESFYKGSIGEVRLISEHFVGPVFPFVFAFKLYKQRYGFSDCP